MSRLASSIGGLAACLLLVGCGFQPVHGTAARLKNASQLESVEIMTDSSRAGQLLKAEIEDQINPTGAPAEKLFVLHITVTETELGLFTNPDGTAGRGDYQLNSSYTLRRKLDQKEIDVGTLSRSSSYNNAQTADFSTFISREDARKRGLLELARDYQLRLSNLVPKLNDPNAKALGSNKLPSIPVTRPLDPGAPNSPFSNPLGSTDETLRP